MSNVPSPTARHADVKQEPVTSVISKGEVVYDPDSEGQVWDADEEVLAALGYKPEFKREFSLWTTFGVSFSVLGLLPSFASTLYYGMGYAGTAGMTWGWLVAMIGLQCVAMSMVRLQAYISDHARTLTGFYRLKYARVCPLPAASTTQRLPWHLLAGALLQLGSQDGLTGLDKSQPLHP